MIHYYSLGRAARYFPERTALVSHGTRSTFRKLHDRVVRLAGALTRHGFKPGDRLAILLPNEPEYIKLVYTLRLAWSYNDSPKHAARSQRNRQHSR